MPIYEYFCQDCQNRFEKLIFSTEEEKNINCPKCKSKKVRRIFSVFGLSGNVSKPFTSVSGGCETCINKTCDSCK